MKNQFLSKFIKLKTTEEVTFQSLVFISGYVPVFRKRTRKPYELSNTQVIYCKSMECGGVCVYYQLSSVDIRRTSVISIGLLLNQIERHGHAFL